jgi:hypothetical protein
LRGTIAAKLTAILDQVNSGRVLREFQRGLQHHIGAARLMAKRGAGLVRG